MIISHHVFYALIEHAWDLLRTKQRRDEGFGRLLLLRSIAQLAESVAADVVFDICFLVDVALERGVDDERRC